MNVTTYTFQSPYPNQVQVGRPDPSASKADATEQGSAELIKSTNTSMNDAKSFQATQTSEVTPTVSNGDTGNTLDIYA